MSNCYCRYEGGSESLRLLEKCKNCIRHDLEMELLTKALRVVEDINQKLNEPTIKAMVKSLKDYFEQ